jgi:hypothetical protein
MLKFVLTSGSRPVAVTASQNHLTSSSGFGMLMTFFPLAKHFNDLSNEACTV